VRTYLGHPNEPEDPGEDRWREVADRGSLRSSASISLTQNVREKDRKGSVASLPKHKARQGVEFDGTTADRVLHGSGFLFFSARSEIGNRRARTSQACV